MTPLLSTSVRWKASWQRPLMEWWYWDALDWLVVVGITVAVHKRGRGTANNWTGVAVRLGYIYDEGTYTT